MDLMIYTPNSFFLDPLQAQIFMTHGLFFLRWFGLCISSKKRYFADVQGMPNCSSSSENKSKAVRFLGLLTGSEKMSPDSL